MITREITRRFFFNSEKTLISYPQELLHSKGVELIKFLIFLYWMCFYQLILILRFLGCFFLFLYALNLCQGLLFQKSQM